MPTAGADTGAAPAGGGFTLRSVEGPCQSRRPQGQGGPAVLRLHLVPRHLPAVSSADRQLSLVARGEAGGAGERPVHHPGPRAGHGRENGTVRRLLSPRNHRPHRWGGRDRRRDRPVRDRLGAQGRRPGRRSATRLPTPTPSSSSAPTGGRRARSGARTAAARRFAQGVLALPGASRVTNLPDRTGAPRAAPAKRPSRAGRGGAGLRIRAPRLPGGFPGLDR